MSRWRASRSDRRPMKTGQLRGAENDLTLGVHCLLITGAKSRVLLPPPIIGARKLRIRLPRIRRSVASAPRESYDHCRCFPAVDPAGKRSWRPFSSGQCASWLCIMSVPPTPVPPQGTVPTPREIDTSGAQADTPATKERSRRCRERRLATARRTLKRASTRRSAAIGPATGYARGLRAMPAHPRVVVTAAGGGEMAGKPFSEDQKRPI